MNNKFSAFSQGSLLVFCLGVLPSCDMFKTKEKEEEKVGKIVAQADTAVKTSKKGTGALLASIGGEAVLYESELNTSITQMLQSNPQSRGASAELLPLSMKRRFLDELITQKIIIKNAQAEGTDSDPKFVEAYEEMMQLVKDSLMVQFFEKGIYDKISISDSDVKEYYNKNKNQFIKVAGGVLVSGAKFDTEVAADEFLNKASKDSQEFETLAKSEGAKFEDFGRVSEHVAPMRGYQMDMTPAPIKETVLALTSFPKIEKVKVGKDFWVVLASDKKDSEYFELTEIKEQISVMLKKNKFREAIELEINTIKKNVIVDVNEDFFKEADESVTPEMNIKEDEDDVASAA